MSVIRSRVLAFLSALALALIAGPSFAAAGDPPAAAPASVITTASAAQAPAATSLAQAPAKKPAQTAAKTPKKPKVAPDAQPTKAASVYLFRGFMGVFSLGMDELQTKLNAQGVKTKLLPHTGWAGVVNEIVAEAKSRPKGRYPIVIVGHSLGANAALMLAYRLGEQGVPVNLVITIDPTVPRPVSPTVGRYFNIYQANNGIGVAIDPAGISPKRVENYNTWDHANLTKPDVTHFTLDKNNDIQKQMYTLIMQALKR